VIAPDIDKNLFGGRENFRSKEWETLTADWSEVAVPEFLESFKWEGGAIRCVVLQLAEQL
jgi:hypothetical protein